LVICNDYPLFGLLAFVGVFTNKVLDIGIASPI